MERRVERTARAIITLGSYVMLCRGKKEPYWHVPGGHCENGEHPAETVKRELWEETGRQVSSLRYITTIQNDFDKDGVHIQEEMALFKATLFPLLQENPAQSNEDHLEFAWCPVVEAGSWGILPPAVIPYIQFVGGT